VSAIYRGYRNHNTQYRQSDVLYTGEKAATGTGSGTSGQSAVGVVTVLRTGVGTGGATTGDSADGLRTAVETASGSGVGAHTAVGLRTAVEIASGSGLGTHTIVSAKAALRTSVSAATSDQVALSFSTTFRVATGSGQGGTDVALWKFPGDPLDLLVVLPPKWSRRKPYTVPQ
jgi:hypothetical protein